MTRLDAEMVRRELARSRQHATELISRGVVTVAGRPAKKSSMSVTEDTELLVEGGQEYASRAGHKLAGALTHFTGLSVRGRTCLDAGASHGGFTDVLLQAGARQVHAVDVGSNQLVPRLREDSRVRVLDRTNVRTLTPEQLGGTVDLTVADVSFISLTLVLEALAACTDPDGDIVPMVKPQFEVGKSRLGSAGVVRSPALRAGSIMQVAKAAHELGWGTRAVIPSGLPGPSGNVEFFLWLRRDAPALARVDAEQAVKEAAQ
ncbi:MAG: TlyA family RNA methyltransferase [Corynebacteriales bacterium]|nr:TlyA family RNA methyltransferase [Mycobacteriales bacterium]